MREAFQLTGHVEAVLVAKDFGTMVSTVCSKIALLRGHGVRGDGHAGGRLADVREKEILRFGLPKGLEIANQREFSAISTEELEQIGQGLQLPRRIPYGCLGENLVVSGIPRLSELPPGTMLFFRKNDQQLRTAVLLVWRENTPCQLPGEAIQQQFPEITDLVSGFSRVSLGRRGIVGSVYASGVVHAGDTVVVMVPRQRVYSPEESS